MNIKNPQNLNNKELKKGYLYDVIDEEKVEYCEFEEECNDKKLYDAEFENCKFNNVSMQNSILEKITFKDVIFEKCNFSNTEFLETTFIRCKFNNCKISGCNFAEERLYNVQLTETNANYGDKLITLSTCEYSQKNGRMIVVAKKIC